MRAQRETFFLASLDRKASLKLITLDIGDKICEQYGSEKELEEVINGKNGDSESIKATLWLTWLLLDDETKEILSKAEFIEWEGMKKKVIKIDDPVDVLKRTIMGADEFKEIFTAIVATFLKSRPELSESFKKKMKNIES